MRRKTILGPCPYCGRRHSRRYRCEPELESWKIDYELREKEDYAGLVAHCEAVAEWSGGDAYALHRLGEAYVLNGQPEKAVELLTEPHRRQPWNEDFQHVILDALFALGKNEKDFDWVECLPVHRLDSSMLDHCHAYLKPKRKPRTVYELHTDLVLQGYCVFTPEELLEAVKGDPRFVVEEEEDFWSPGIRARRKRDVTTKPGPSDER